VIPLRDDNPQFLTPFVTTGLIGVNLLVWIFVQGLGSDPSLTRSVCVYGMIPGELLQTLPAGTRIQLSALEACELSAHPAWHTLVTSIFLHAGWLHLIGNMWFLWIFGNNVEDSMGHLRFGLFYLLCGLAATALQIVSDPDSPLPMVGASGAIGGVMGAYIVLYPRVHVHMLVFLGFFATTIAMPAVLMLGYWLLLQLIGGFGSLGSETGGVAFWAHVGGFAAGALLVLPFSNRELLDRHPYHGWSPQRMPSRSWRRVR
jgi:membrane associated rhomboid family serine protease